MNCMEQQQHVYNIQSALGVRSFSNGGIYIYTYKNLHFSRVKAITMLAAVAGRALTPRSLAQAREISKPTRIVQQQQASVNELNRRQ